MPFYFLYKLKLCVILLVLCDDFFSVLRDWSVNRWHSTSPNTNHWCFYQGCVCLDQYDLQVFSLIRFKILKFDILITNLLLLLCFWLWVGIIDLYKIYLLIHWSRLDLRLSLMQNWIDYAKFSVSQQLGKPGWDKACSYAARK